MKIVRSADGMALGSIEEKQWRQRFLPAVFVGVFTLKKIDERY